VTDRSSNRSTLVAYQDFGCTSLPYETAAAPATNILRYYIMDIAQDALFWSARTFLRRLVTFSREQSCPFQSQYLMQIRSLTFHGTPRLRFQQRIVITPAAPITVLKSCPETNHILVTLTRSPRHGRMSRLHHRHIMGSETLLAFTRQDLIVTAGSTEETRCGWL
jgi:hypothetical protein